MPLTLSSNNQNIVYIKPLPNGTQWNSVYQTYTAPSSKIQTTGVSSLRPIIVYNVPWDKSQGYRTY